MMTSGTATTATVSGKWPATSTTTTTTQTVPPFLTPNDADIRPPPPLLPSLPDDFDLFETTATTRHCKVTLAPRFSQGMFDLNQPAGNEHKNNENNYFSSQMIASAPKIPFTDTPSFSTRMNMRPTPFWNSTDEQP